MTSLVDKIRPFGIAKIVPPPSFKPPSAESVEMSIPNAVTQSISGGAGKFLITSSEIAAQSARLFMMVSDQYQRPETTRSTVEQMFWRSIKGTPSVYGADIPGTIFQDYDHPWNVNLMTECLLRKHLPPDNATIPGVTSSMLYFGTWKSLFALHVEDMDLFSISYLHSGEPKRWYGGCPDDAHRIESLAQVSFPQVAGEKHGGHFLRTKTCIMSPEMYREAGIKLTTALQEKGQFVVTLPRAYHFGFNYGTNIAEATNFALRSWFDVALKRERMREHQRWRQEDPDEHVYLEPRFFFEQELLSEHGGVIPEGEDKEKIRDWLERKDSGHDEIGGGARNMVGGSRSMRGFVGGGSRSMAGNNNQNKTEAHGKAAGSNVPKKRKKRKPRKPPVTRLTPQQLLKRAKTAALPDWVTGVSSASETVGEKSQLPTAPFASMTVAQLRTQLRAQHLSTQGKKSELVERLKTSTFKPTNALSSSSSSSRTVSHEVPPEILAAFEQVKQGRRRPTAGRKIEMYMVAEGEWIKGTIRKQEYAAGKILVEFADNVCELFDPVLDVWRFDDPPKK